MPDNITPGGLNFRTFVGPRTARLIGDLQPGELDLRSILTNTRVRSLYINNNGVYRVFRPGNPFSPAKTLEPGDGVAIDALQGFESELFFPGPNAARKLQIISAISEINDPPSLDQNIATRLPNLPASKRSDLAQAAELAASTNPFTALNAIDTLAAIRTWLSFEFAAVTLEFGNQIRSVRSWGNSTDGLEQLVSGFQPLLTLSGAEFSTNPPAWLSYNGQFLSNTSFTLYVVERRDALNAGWILGGSSSANNANLQVGYSSPTVFSFNRLGGSDLNYTVPSALSSEFLYWALRFDGTTRSIWLNGVKVAEVADTIPLGSYNGSAIGYNYEPSYIGKVRHYLTSVVAMSSDQIGQVTGLLRSYTSLYSTSPDEVASGTINITQPLANAAISVGNNGLGQLLIEGSFTLTEDSPPLKAIEYSLAGGIYKTIISNPTNLNFLVAQNELPASGNLVVRFKDNPEVSATIANVSIIDARVSSLTAQVTNKTIAANWIAPTGVTPLNYFVEISSDSGTTWGERQTIAAPTTTASYTNRIGGSYLIRVQTQIDTSVSAWVVLVSPAIVEPTPPATINANLLSTATSIWRFSGNTTDAKAIGNFTTTGTLTYTDALRAGGGINESAVFDGVTYLRDSSTTRYKLENQHTIVLLAKNTGTNTSTTRVAPLVNKRDNFPGSRSWAIGLESNLSGDRITLSYSSDGQSNTGTVSSAYFPAGTPLLAIIQYSKAAFFRLKVNNATNWVDHGPVTAAVRNFGLAVGASLREGAPENYLIGQMDFLLWFDRILDAEEVPYLWNSGTPIQI